MKRITKGVLRRIKSIFRKKKEVYDFNKSNPLGGNGERVDIQLQKIFEFQKLDMYQKSHFKRYEFAKKIITEDSICGDFACGTGYGSVLISDKASKVIGADIDEEVITAIKERYKEKTNITFLNENLLNLKFDELLDTIISFETIEHFTEEDIKLLLKIFAKFLKENGQLIFSTPYKQERSEGAIKLGFHLTFYIDENKINEWLNEAGFKTESIKYQNYDTHNIQNDLEKKDFIICVARKITDG
ncbi:class I SAM-dependent methyltransferase [Flavobacterium sp. WC2409]|uniref:Class I SAM-dependent methyltransferase n=1 Tax=Flavobacterium sp. WC2409 TaxID=3234139 RepID=A0AB39W339_9FLAO